MIVNTPFMCSLIIDFIKEVKKHIELIPINTAKRFIATFNTPENTRYTLNELLDYRSLDLALAYPEESGTEITAVMLFNLGTRLHDMVMAYEPVNNSFYVDGDTINVGVCLIRDANNNYGYSMDIWDAHRIATTYKRLKVYIGED